MASGSAGRVVIVGAGLAGLCLAQALVRHGVDVHVYERDAADRPRRQGYRITIDRHGLAALEHCLPPELFELVMATKGVPGGRFRYTDWKLRDVFALSFDTKPEDGGQVDRQTLHAILRIGLEGRIHFGMTAVAVLQTRDVATVRFADGTSASGDVVVAADGVGSVLRAQIVSDATPEPSPFSGIYGATPLVQDGSSIVPEALRRSGVLAIGTEPGLAFFFTSMRFPEPPAEAFARLAPHVGAPVSGDYVMWGLVFPQREQPADIQHADAETVHRFATVLARSYHPTLRRMVETSDPASVLVSRFSVAERPSSWDRSRVTLMGDAVHVMPPFGAHGGNTALRDAEALARRLLEAPAASWEPALAAYQEEMETYAFEAVATAGRSMRQLEMRPLLRWFMLKVLTRFHRVTVPVP